MTLELEQELKALTQLMKNPRIRQIEIIDLFQQLNIVNTEHLFYKFLNAKYFNAEEDLTIGTAENPSWGPDHHDRARMYTLSAVGLTYLEFLIDEKKKEIIADQQIQSVIDTNKSVKQTNESVISTNDAIKTSIKSQNNSNRITLIIAGVAVLISLFTLLKDLYRSDKLQLEVPPTIDSILQRTSQTLDSVNQTLYQIHRDNKILKDSLKTP